MATIRSNLPASSAENQHTESNISTKRHRWQVHIKICGIAVLTILSIAFPIAEVVFTANHLKQQQQLKETIEVSIKVSRLINSLQEERRSSVVFLYCKLNISNELKEKQHTTDKNINDLRPDFEVLGVSLKKIHDVRLSPENKSNHSRTYIAKYYTAYTSAIKDCVSFVVKHTQNTDYSNDMAALLMIIKTEVEIEKKNALMGQYCLFNNTSNVTKQNISDSKARSGAFLEAARQLSQGVNNDYLSLKKKMNVSSLSGKQEASCPGISSCNSTSQKESIEILSSTKNYSILLYRLAEYEAGRISLKVEKNVHKFTILLSLRCIIVCVVLILLPFLIISLVKVQNEFYKYAHALHDKIDLEQSRTEFLLGENARHMEGKLY